MVSLHRARRWMRPKGGTPTVAVSLALAALSAAACAHPNSSVGSTSPANTADKANVAEAVTCNAGNNNCDRASIEPMPDPRVGLKAGGWDAGQAEWNMHLLSNGRTPEGFDGKTNSDLAFLGNYVIQGNYKGFQVWDISNPVPANAQDRVRLPRVAERRVGVQEPAVRVVRSADRAPRLRRRCAQGHRELGAHPRHPYLGHQRHRAPEEHRQRPDVPRVAHAHAAGRSEGPRRRLHLYLGIGGRSFAERAGRLRQRGSRTRTPTRRKFRIEVIKVPLAHPEQAAIVSSPRIFEGLGAGGNARPSAAGYRRRGRRPVPTAGSS